MSKVIKNFESSPQAQATSVFAMAEIGDEAIRIIATAEEKARRILDEARAQAEVMKRQASAKGLEEGKASVRGKVEQQLAEEIRKTRTREVANLVKSLETMIREVNDYRGRLMMDSKDQLITLAVNIARTVIKREVNCGDDIARLNLEEAIRLSARRSRLLIRVSEMDMKMCEDLLASQPLLNEPDSAIEVLPSAEIMPGGCLIESASGSVDARIETQLREIEKVLLGERNND